MSDLQQYLDTIEENRREIADLRSKLMAAHTAFDARKQELEQAQTNVRHWRENCGKLDGKVRELSAWKESAMAVTPPLQDIAKALSLPLGESIHDKILPAIKETLAAYDCKVREITELRARHRDLSAAHATQAQELRQARLECERMKRESK